MQCPHCGELVPEGSELCPECGVNLKDAAEHAALGARSVRRLSKTALWLGFASILLNLIAAIPAFILAGIALKRSSRLASSPGRGSLATSALFVAALGVLLNFTLIAVYYNLAPALAVNRAADLRADCFLSMHKLSGAAMMYTRDWDGLGPRGINWVDAIFQYHSDPKALRCPASDQDYGYGLNIVVAGKPFEQLPEPGYLVLLFESDGGCNCCGGAGQLVREPRHMGGNNFAFADGHVKWFITPSPKVSWTAALIDAED